MRTIGTIVFASGHEFVEDRVELFIDDVIVADGPSKEIQPLIDELKNDPEKLEVVYNIV